jgi:cellulose biosynthesis protein BcsQ
METKESKKEPVYVAFSTQKGGAGKTTLTVLVASYLHYVKGYTVAVIDCDYPQHSIQQMRERDFKMVESDEYYKGMAYEQITRLGGKKFYHVVESSPGEALADARHLVPQGSFDFIFFDLPGTINSRGVIQTLLNVDYIISPISADRVVLESTLDYLLTVREQIKKVGKTHVKGIHLLWNLVDGREKSELYGVYEAVIAELGFSLLKTFIPNSLRFRHEQSVGHKALFRSTLFPADKSLIRGSNLDALTDELLELFK